MDEAMAHLYQAITGKVPGAQLGNVKKFWKDRLDPKDATQQTPEQIDISRYNTCKQLMDSVGLFKGEGNIYQYLDNQGGIAFLTMAHNTFWHDINSEVHNLPDLNVVHDTLNALTDPVNIQKVCPLQHYGAVKAIVEFLMHVLLQNSPQDSEQ